MIKHGLLLLSCLLISFTTPVTTTALASNDHPKVVYIYDGDTVKLSNGKSTYKLRITDIDAPERNQTHGLKSRRALIKLCNKAEIDVVLEKEDDKYNRRLGQLYCNAQSVALYMAANGHAWSQGKRYTKDKAVLTAAKEARKQKLGLWKNDDAIPPWKWRKRYMYK